MLQTVLPYAVAATTGPRHDNAATFYKVLRGAESASQENVCAILRFAKTLESILSQTHLLYSVTLLVMLIHPVFISLFSYLLNLIS